MAAEYGATLLFVRKTIALGTPATAAWSAVLDHISDDIGPHVLARWRDLRVADDLERLKAWLLEVLEVTPPPQTIRGLRFGLCHPELAGRPSCDIMLTGTASFDRESDAWGYDATWQPQARPRSLILDALYSISAEERFAGKPAVVHVCLWFALIAVAELCRACFAAIRARAPVQGVGVGFDDGDLINLGVQSKSGFAPLPVDDKKRKAKGARLLPGEYFKLEGGPDVLMCRCTSESIPQDVFRACAPIDPVRLDADVDPNWPEQTGTFGSLAPFHVGFVSAAVAAQLEREFPNEVQFHELRIGSSSQHWRVMQVLRSVKCFDRKMSTQQRQLTLVRDAAAGHNIFFVGGYYEGQAVIVSRAAAQLMIDQGVTGATFIPVATS